MIVLSHRGWWTEPRDKNSRNAFSRSFESGFGLETDVRDRAGTLVISHDPPHGEELTLDEFLSIPGQAGLPLALNVKADGLASGIAQALADHPESGDAFVFDMSVPDMRAYFETGVPVFTRMSEVERTPAWLERCSGVWLDGFEGQWFECSLVEDLLAKNKKVCVVSPELHGRGYETMWESLAELAPSDGLLLCTDLPAEARNYF